MPDPGNSLRGARSLADVNTAGASASDRIGGDDPHDYYWFNTNGGNFLVTLTGLTSNADMELLDSRGDQMSLSTQRGNYAEAIGYAGLPSGEYYLHVYPGPGSGATGTRYDLTIAVDTPLLPDRAGSTREASRNLGSLGSRRVVVRDSVGFNDEYDYYRFTTTGGNLIVTLTGLTQNADLYLKMVDRYNIEQEMVSSVRYGQGSEAVGSGSLEPGTYYIVVRRFSSNENTNYTLTASVSPIGRSAPRAVTGALLTEPLFQNSITAANPSARIGNLGLYSTPTVSHQLYASS